MDRGTIQGVKLVFRGEVATKNTRLVKLSFAAGWMESAMNEPVNLVSAESLLKSRGITIIEEKSPETADFGTLIQAEVTSDRKTYIAAGTLFGKTQLRLVKLGPYRLDATLDGTLFVFSHRDVPGLIGFMGTTMGKYGVNIAGMSVGREADAPGGEAIGVVNLDSAPPAEALEQLTANPNILSVSLVKLPKSGVMPPWLGGI
jgi:D-3-phosphoglycerate dehydrogenase